MTASWGWPHQGNLMAARHALAADPRVETSLPFEPGVLPRLRAATRATHDALDALLPRGLGTLHDYRRYLGALLPLAEWLARGWNPLWPAPLARWNDAPRLACLRHDAAALAVPGRPAGATPAATAAEWLGGCYVIEGSALGARILSRHASALADGHPEVAGARRFLAHITADSRRWPRFMEQLDTLPRTQGAAAVAGARTGFGIVHAGLTTKGTQA
jgi:heme oxygenase